MLRIRVWNREAAVRPRWRGIGLFPGFPKLEVAFILAEVTILLSGICLFRHYSRELNRYADGRLLEPGAGGGPALVMAAPREVSVGGHATPASLQARLRNALYAEGSTGSLVGTFRLTADGLEIHPGPHSYFRHAEVREGPVIVKFHKGCIVAIDSLNGGPARQNYWLEPEVITALSGFARAEQHVVRYGDVPPVLRDAVLAAEDHRFFSHHGVNFVRLLRAARADFRADGRVQGGSTLTMQLARNLFLSPQRTFRRKLKEIVLALFLETRLNKQQIFELYANRVYLGQHRNFGIFGFGDAAQAYFGKDITRLNLSQAALLAGAICAPNWYSPYKYPERARQRRNFVLRQMVETGYISPAEGQRATSSPLGVVPPTALEANQQGYFEDMVTEQLRNRFSERQINFDGLKVYTTIDLDLQGAATQAAQIASVAVDRLVNRGRPLKAAAPGAPNRPQLALVVLDPHNGDVKALIGGRDYGASQLNHALALRQPGSVFKPFVYAAALDSGVDGSQPIITPATLLEDEPTEFEFGRGKTYAPRDYKEEYHGTVTVRQALTDSLNVPTVGLAQVAGFDKVRNLALAAGFNSRLKATPSIALGAYVATPLEVAGAYTVFANGGWYAAPHCIVEIDDAAGRSVWTDSAASRRVLDPRVTYLMVNLLQGVIDHGTGWGVRTRGFSLPAAGKTGTSHDGWFAGFTSNLLAVAWMGYDDDRQLNLSGADSALPLWTEFLKRASAYPAYRDAAPFTPPAGVVSAPVATQSTSPDSPNTLTVTVRDEYFIVGTEPDPPSPDEPASAVTGQAATPQTPLDTGGQLIGVALTSTSSPASAEPIANQEAPTTPAPAVMQGVQAPLLSELFPPQAPASGSPQTGELCIKTDPPGLEVFVDGKPVGASPAMLPEPVGDHTYRVVPPSGKIPILRSVQVKPAELETVNIHY